MSFSWLEQIAPTVATALGGPLAGIATEVIGKVFGVKPVDAQKMLEAGKMTSDQLAQLKNAEIELQKIEAQLGLNFEQLNVADRDSARKMQIAVRSWLPPTLSLIVTAGFFGILCLLMLGVVRESNALMIMLGSLGTAWTGIIAFYFGSSSSSQRKDEMIYNSTPVQTK